MYLPIHLDILRSYTYANYTLMNKLPHKCFWWNLIVLSWIHQQTVIPFIIIHFDIIIQGRTVLQTHLGLIKIKAPLPFPVEDLDKQSDRLLIKIIFYGILYMLYNGDLNSQLESLFLGFSKEDLLIFL